MAPPKGIKSLTWLRNRKIAQRGGGSPHTDTFDRSVPDSLAVLRDFYLEALGMRNYANGTLNGRRDSLKFFLMWAAVRRLHSVSQITRDHLEEYQRWLWLFTGTTGERLCWSTQRNRLSAIKCFFHWLTRKHFIAHNPASELELPRTESRLPEPVLTVHEVEKLLAIPNLSDPLGVRNRTMLEVFYSTGIRRAELCRLELPDANIDQSTLHIRLGKGKKDRIVPLGNRTIYWLERYLMETRPRLCSDTQSKALFLTCYGAAFNPDVVSWMVSSWMRHAGIKRKSCCHALRHCCATHMLENGADIRFIQKLLGHAKLDTTAIYTQVSIKQLQEVHARCHPAAKLENNCFTRGNGQFLALNQGGKD